MKILLKNSAFIGVVLTYLWFFISIKFETYEPKYVMYGYMFEFLVIAFFYFIVRLYDTYKRPKEYAKSQSVFTILLALFPFILICNFLVVLSIASIYQSTIEFESINNLINPFVLISLFIMLMFHVLQLFQLQNHEERVRATLDNFIVEILVLMLGNLLFYFIVRFSGITSITQALVILLLLRMLIEIYYRYRIKKSI